MRYYDLPKASPGFTKDQINYLAEKTSPLSAKPFNILLIALAVCDKTAQALKDLGRDDIHISESTFFYDGGGCC